MSNPANNLPQSLQVLDPGIRMGDIQALANAVAQWLYASSQDAITASTTQTQVGGTVLNATISRITSANSSDAVTLGFSASPGRSFEIINDSGQTISLFPKSGDKLNDASKDAAVTIADNTISYYSCPKIGLWFGGPATLEA